MYTRSLRIIMVLLCFAAASACTTIKPVEPQASVAPACPWVGAEADTFSGWTNPEVPDFQPQVRASGQRDNNAEVASLLKQSEACGWRPSLVSVARTDEGAAFEIDLVRQ